MRATNLDDVIAPEAYYGLKAIAKRMGMSSHRIKTLCTRYHFPLLRLPGKCSRGWLYYTDERLILAWQSGLIQNTRRYLLERKARGTSTVREKQEPQGLPWQVANTTEQACLQAVSSVQPAHDTSKGPSQNTSNDADLGGWVG